MNYNDRVNIPPETWDISPGNTVVIGMCVDLLGQGRVFPGAWGNPVQVAASDEEMEALRTLLNEHTAHPLRIRRL